MGGGESESAQPQAKPGRGGARCHERKSAVDMKMASPLQMEGGIERQGGTSFTLKEETELGHSPKWLIMARIFLTKMAPIMGKSRRGTG